MCYNFTDKWWNKDNSFLNNLFKVTSFEVIAPKVYSSPSSIVVASIMPLTLGFRN